MSNPDHLPRILVIDDEPMIGRAIRRSLVKWNVTLSEEPADALKRIGDGERFDVIVCDMMMPVMTGAALHDELVILVPEQAARMLFLTGGALTAETRAFVDEHADRVMAKPFEMQELERWIQERVGG